MVCGLYAFGDGSVASEPNQCSLSLLPAANLLCAILVDSDMRMCFCWKR